MRIFSVLVMATAMTSFSRAQQQQQQQTFPPIAGYQPRTDVSDYLTKDLIQKEFEDVMFSETCAAFDRGKAFWYDNSETKGGYLRSLPTYRDTVSDEWNEFVEYTGRDDFHIQWVDRAFARYRTPNFLRGNANWKKAFGGPSEEGKNIGVMDIEHPGTESDIDGPCVAYEESVKKATAFTFNLLECMQLLQKAIDLAPTCVAQSNGCKDTILAWDAAVAIYVGSLEGADGNNIDGGHYGKSIYALADKRCDDYGVCGPTGEGVNRSEPGSVNIRIMGYFAAGSHAAFAGDARQMEYYKRAISAKITVLFVQGTIRYAWRLSDEGGEGTVSTLDKDIAEGGTFALGAIPKLWACSSKGAAKAEKEVKIGGLKAGSTPINFQNVKLAFECNYRCLGISCSEVGSLYDKAPDPLPGAATCNDLENGSSPDFLCHKPSKETQQKCRMFTGKPGIPGRDRPGYYGSDLSLE